MPALLEHGQKVSYRQGNKWLKGVVHAVKTHETEKGIITRIAYLINTGNDNPDFDGLEDEHRQPEQVEVEQNFVKLA